jgi:hypothetical protein
MAFSVSIPVTLSTRKAWFSEPRLNFSSRRRRNSGAAPAAGLEIGDRQRQQVTEQPGAELDVDTVCRMRKLVDAQRLENGLEHGQHDKPDDQHVERAHASMHEHLVDHHLEEQRRDEGKELKEERDDQHFADTGTCESPRETM